MGSVIRTSYVLRHPVVVAVAGFLHLLFWIVYVSILFAWLVCLLAWRGGTWALAAARAHRPGKAIPPPPSGTGGSADGGATTGSYWR